MKQEFLNLVREKAREKILFLPHAARQMMHPDRMISTTDVRKVILKGKSLKTIQKMQEVIVVLCLDMGRTKGHCMLYARQRMNIY